ncbi:hypothetical protein V8C35DRAFT_328900 [Trichoderma chlorosporum]
MGEVVETREKALSHQKRVLAQAIKDAKNDIREIRRIYWGAVRSILGAKGQRIRFLFPIGLKDYGLDYIACQSMVAVRKYEVEALHRRETENIEIAFRDASEKTNEEYDALLDYMLDNGTQTTVVEI